MPLAPIADANKAEGETELGWWEPLEDPEVPLCSVPPTPGVLDLSFLTINENWLYAAIGIERVKITNIIIVGIFDMILARLPEGNNCMKIN